MNLQNIQKNKLVLNIAIVIVSGVLSFFASSYIYETRIKKPLYIIDTEKLIESGCSIHDIKEYTDQINGIILDSSVVILSKDGIDITEEIYKKLDCLKKERGF